MLCSVPWLHSPFRSSWGCPIVIHVSCSQSHKLKDFTIISHTNETMASIRRKIRQQWVTGGVRVDLAIECDSSSGLYKYHLWSAYYSVACDDCIFVPLCHRLHLNPSSGLEMRCGMDTIQVQEGHQYVSLWAQGDTLVRGKVGRLFTSWVWALSYLQLAIHTHSTFLLSLVKVLSCPLVSIL